MAKKNQKIIKLLKKIAEDIDNISLNDPDGWREIDKQLGDGLKSVPKKETAIKALLESVGHGFEAMGAQAAKEPLALADAIWQALTAAEQALAGDSDSDGQVEDSQQKLGDILASLAKTDASGPVAGAQETSHPAIDSLDDAAAFLIQLEPDDLNELHILRGSLLNLSGGGGVAGSVCRRLEQAVQKIDQLTTGVSDDPDQTLADVGTLLEAAMDPNESEADPRDGAADPIDDDDRAASDTGGPSNADDSDFDHMPTDADAELIGEFIAEGSDLNEKAEEALLSLETNPEDMESIGTVFRAFHTVKGTSAFLELTLISELGHHAESLLSRVRDGEIRYSGGYADLSLRALDMIKELMAGVQAALSGAPLLKPAGYDDLVKVLADPESAGISDEADDVVAPRVGDLLVAQGKIDRQALEEAVETHPDEKLGVAVVKSKGASVKDVGQALRAQKRIQSSQKVVESSVRVSTQRLDRLIDMVGELVIAHSMVAQDDLIVSSDNHDLVKKVAHSSKIVRELQDISMSMRMVPLKATFNKMARLVRDVARKVGKNVNLITEGEDTEIDRNLVNIINDPLVHMVRNAVDHGIELPEERIKSGKPEAGEVQLLAYHSAGSVVVEIRDDGKGLEREMIINKAREKGLIGDSGEDRSLSDRDVFNMIFEPGFSTAQAVTDVSGRGVGMDVVKKNIESLRGQVEIKSEFGQGSVFKMSLPLTLAIIDGMVVRVGSETYVIPTVSIIRSIKPEAGSISTVLNRGEMLTLPSGLVPLYRMDRLFHIEGAQDDPDEAIIVIVEDEERQAGLVVDELFGRQQVVIKSLGESMKNIPGISGGAIMPDGRVGLIIDVGGLVKLANNGDDGDHRDEVESSVDQTLAA